MKEFVEKLISKLNDLGGCDASCEYDKGWDDAIGEAIEIVNQLAEECNNTSTDISTNQLGERIEEKIKVTSLEIIVTGTKDNPYFEIKYKKVGKEDYNIGYSSYDLNNVFSWKEECFEIVEQLAEEFATDINAGNKNEKMINDIKFAIEASDVNDDYTTDLRNGMRYCLALVDGKEQEFEKCNQDLTQYNQGWILCSERLPESKGTYLVCSKGIIWVANYFHNTWWGIEKRCRWVDVEAWQPLPSPYKPEEKTKFTNEELDRIMDKILDS